jgi:hypothetical protein
MTNRPGNAASPIDVAETAIYASLLALADRLAEAANLAALAADHFEKHLKLERVSSIARSVLIRVIGGAP